MWNGLGELTGDDDPGPYCFLWILEMMIRIMYRMISIITITSDEREYMYSLRT